VLAQQRQNNEEEGEADFKKGISLRATARERQAREIDELLKKGAYDVFRDEDDSEAQQFMETDIDALLERSSKSISYGSTNNTISSGLGSFSKASFVTSNEEGGQDVDLDDPDFWKKAIGLQAPEFPVDEDTALLLGSDKKRNRKQVQVYDPYASFAEAEMKKEELKLKREMNEKQATERIKQ
jgi:chromodomain-helicase-DNA-binding protein 7